MRIDWNRRGRQGGRPPSCRRRRGWTFTTSGRTASRCCLATTNIKSARTVDGGARRRVRAARGKIAARAGIEVRIVDPKRVANYAKAAGGSQNDSLDASGSHGCGDLADKPVGRTIPTARSGSTSWSAGRWCGEVIGQAVANGKEHEVAPELQQIYQELAIL